MPVQRRQRTDESGCPSTAADDHIVSPQFIDRDLRSDFASLLGHVQAGDLVEHIGCSSSARSPPSPDDHDRTSQCSSLATSIESSASAQEAQRQLRLLQEDYQRLHVLARSTLEENARLKQEVQGASAAAAVHAKEAEAGRAAAQASHFAVKMPAKQRKRQLGVPKKLRAKLFGATGIMTEEKNKRLRHHRRPFAAVVSPALLLLCYDVLCCAGNTSPNGTRTKSI